MGLRQNLVPQRVAEHWDGLPGALAGSPPWRCVRDVWTWCLGTQLSGGTRCDQVPGHFSWAKFPLAALQNWRIPPIPSQATHKVCREARKCDTDGDGSSAAPLGYTSIQGAPILVLSPTDTSLLEKGGGVNIPGLLSLQSRQGFDPFLSAATKMYET